MQALLAQLMCHNPSSRSQIRTLPNPALGTGFKLPRIITPKAFANLSPRLERSDNPGIKNRNFFFEPCKGSAVDKRRQSIQHSSPGDCRCFSVFQTEPVLCGTICYAFACVQAARTIASYSLLRLLRVSALGRFLAGQVRVSRALAASSVCRLSSCA